MTDLQQVAVLALAVSSISVSISRGGVFSNQRRWLLRHSNWLGRLFTCPYCLSHWLAMLLVGIYQPRLVYYWLPFDLIISVFIMVAISAVVIGIITRLIPMAAEREELDYLQESLLEAKSVINKLKGD